MKVFILAGGFATRLWPLTEHRAKPMLLVDGQPILGHILAKVPKQAEVFLLTNSRFAPDFEAYLNATDYTAKIFCEDAHCDTDKLGALAAIAEAVKHFKVDDNLLVVAGDNLLPQLDLNDLVPQIDEARLAVQAVETLHEARSFGVVELGAEITKNSFEVTTFEEKPEHPKSKYVSTGFMGIGKNLLPGLLKFAQASPDALGAVITQYLNQSHPVQAQVVKGDWFDVGSYEAYLAAHKALQTKAVLTESGAELINCQCQGKVYVGEGAVVKDSVLIDAVIYPHTKLENCHITQSVIDENCHIKGVDLSRKLVRHSTQLRAD